MVSAALAVDLVGEVAVGPAMTVGFSLRLSLRPRLDARAGNLIGIMCVNILSPPNDPVRLRLLCNEGELELSS